jgi:hypothetical protein
LVPGCVVRGIFWRNFHQLFPIFDWECIETNEHQQSKDRYAFDWVLYSLLETDLAVSWPWFKYLEAQPCSDT